ncbi:3-phosphoglycerate dehydrogenase [bacterium]|nr:3-phosphoglycerate dehydrogenase [bacterium]
MKKVLIATVKPFAPAAVNTIEKLFQEAGYEVSKLEKYGEQADLVNGVKGYDAVIIRSDKVTKEVVDSADAMKIVVRAGAGYDNVDLSAATEKGVVVMNTPGQNSNAVAELALGMMVFGARNMFQPKAGTELKGKKLGIHAYGNVGKLVADIAKGYGMEIYAFDPFVAKEKIEADGVTVVNTVEELYATCNYISLHIPSNDKTKNSINYDLLSKMPEGATLVNTARKEVVDEEGLKKLFAARSDFRYLTDIAPVIAAELKENYPERFFATPKKMGAQTKEANVNAGAAAATQIINFFEKSDTTFKVN